jgi:hypothetical protein
MLSDEFSYSARCVPQVGIAIREYVHLWGTTFHCGFVYLTDDGSPRICHLAWHHDLRDDPFTPNYLWHNIPGIDSVNRSYLAALLDELGQNPPNIPYGLDPGGSCFDENGKFLPPPLGKGLTCATFITAVLNARGFKIVDFSTWPPRADDQQFFSFVLKTLPHSASAQHIEELKKDLGAARLRPSEITGACSVFSDELVRFKEAEGLGNKIEREIGEFRHTLQQVRIDQ